MKTVKDVRDIDALRQVITERLNIAMSSIYREASELGYDSTEARLEACRLMSDRTIDVALTDHRRSPIRAVEKLNRLLKGKGVDWDSLADLP